MAQKTTSKKTEKSEKPAKAVTAKPGSQLEPRRFTPASFKSRRRRRKAERKLARTKLPSSFKLFSQSIKMLTNHWEVFGGILLIYMFLNMILVGGFTGAEELQQLKDELGYVLTGQFGELGTGLTLFGFLITSGTSVASGVAGAYQTILLVLVSLAIVWALRQQYAGNKIRIRDAFYNSSYPLVQLLLVLLMLSLHLIPVIIGTFLFSTLVLGEILTVGWQQALTSGVSLLLATWSAYLLCHSLFAAYIVTLPDMTPLKALRSAKDIVQYRRGMVLRKVLFLPVALLFVGALILVPLAALFTTAAAAVYFVLSMMAVLVVHSYMYSLYRELIQ
jgi:hypothetical protein